MRKTHDMDINGRYRRVWEKGKRQTQVWKEWIERKRGEGKILHKTQLLDYQTNAFQQT